MWVGFFIFSGLANLYVAFSGQFSEEAWVNFKLFGMLGLTLIFIVLQGIYLTRHIDRKQAEKPNTNE
jgi:intracellular septation protein